MTRLILTCLAAFAVATTVPLADPRSTFVPDWTFTGSALDGWQVLGQARWQADNGELVGTPTAPEGGWLVLDRAFQNIQLGADFRCDSGCRTGVLLRAERLPDGGMKGIYVSLVEGETGSFAVTIDAAGRELTREPLITGGSGTGRVPAPPPAAESGQGRGGRGQGQAAAPAAGRGAGGGGRGQSVQAIVPRVVTGLKPGDWNDLEIILDVRRLRPFVNTGAQGNWAVELEMGRYGPIALHTAGTGQVRYRGVSYKDIAFRHLPKEVLSPHFTMQRLTPLHYAWSQAAADFNRDNHLDIAIGPFVFLGPDFQTAFEFTPSVTFNPSDQYPSMMVSFAGDFNGDGWPDIITTNGGRLFLNPRGESRLWDMHNVLAGASEISVMADIDGDGRLELVHAAQGSMRWSKPDPNNPAGPWISTQVSEQGTTTAHGVGAGDINGDGRIDIVNAYGWWEQPTRGTTGLWTYRPHAFSHGSGRGLEGGTEMLVFDVNGDGLNDVVTGLQAHVFGVAWFQQQRDAAGNISFVRHMIMNDFSTENAGGVTFSQAHGMTAADVDGDGVTDLVVGKRYWSHQEGYADPDPYGAPVLYLYRTVRNPQAPGGAQFVPELIHNWSGAGSQLLATDINKDGVVDIVTSGAFGSYVFYGKRR